MQNITVDINDVELSGSPEQLWKIVESLNGYNLPYNPWTHYLSQAGQLHEICGMNQRHRINAAKKHLSESMFLTTDVFSCLKLVEEMIDINKLPLDEFPVSGPPLIELYNRVNNITSGYITFEKDGVVYGGDCNKVAELSGENLLSRFNDYKKASHNFILEACRHAMGELLVYNYELFNLQSMLVKYPILGGLLMGIREE